MQAEFKRLFKKLIKASRGNKVLELALLRVKLPTQAWEAIAGIIKPHKALTLLDKQYGDRNITIMSAIHRMETLKLSHRPTTTKSKQSRSWMRLLAVSAKHHLFAGCLTIDKLETAAQTCWFYYQAKHPK